MVKRLADKVTFLLGQDRKYDVMKQYHIQQDANDACSLAAFLVVRNTIEGQRKTQRGMRATLDAMKNGWVKRVSGRKNGLFVKTFALYANDYFTLHMPEYRANLVYTRSLTAAKFDQLLNEIANINTFKFVIFNYDAHYSPLGDYDPETKKLTILDVDYNKVYGSETIYKGNRGEREFSSADFYRKLCRQKRFLLIIERRS